MLDACSNKSHVSNTDITQHKTCEQKALPKVGLKNQAMHNPTLVICNSILKKRSISPFDIQSQSMMKNEKPKPCYCTQDHSSQVGKTKYTQH